MKHLRILCLIGVLLITVGLITTSVAAQKFAYTAGIQVQNLENSTADVSITFYKKDGIVETTVNDTISSSGSKTYFPLQVSAGFDGSAVVSSSKQVAAVVNVLGNNGVAASSYVGTSNGNTTVSLPLLMKGNAGFDSWFNVQNVGSGPANITINYSDGTSRTSTIPVNASATFNQAAETHSLSVFSAIITSNQPVVAAVIEESSSVMFAYSGFVGGSTNPVMPLINTNNGGYITGAQIQNVGTSSTNVTVTYTPSTAGTSCTETQSISAGSSKTFTLGAFSNGANSNCVGGQRFVGSARVTSNSTNQPLVVVVNQLLPGRNGEAYGSFNPDLATNKVVMPLIMDRNSGYFTGFNVMNVGISPATVNCTFSGTTYTVSRTLSPGQALTDIQNGKIHSAYVGSGTCTADTGAKIVGVVNQLGPSGTSDQLLVYEGINN